MSIAATSRRLLRTVPVMLFLVMLLGVQQPAHAVSLVGDQVSCTMQPSAFWECNPSSTTVTDPGGAEFSLVAGADTFFSVDIAASIIRIIALQNNFPASGVVLLSDLDAGSPIVGFSITTNVANVVSGDVVVGATSVSADLSGTQWTAGSSFLEIVLEFAPVDVPEPTTLTLLGAGLLGLVGLRRRNVVTVALSALAVFAPLNAAMAAAPITVPEPASLSLMAVGVAGALIAARFRKK